MLKAALPALIALLAAPAASAFEFQEGLLLEPVGLYGRVPFPRDPIQAVIAAGAWKAPSEGDRVEKAGGGAAEWKKTKADDGHFATENLGGGYLYAKLESPAERVMLLDAVGHNMVYVNGEPRVGDPYRYGYVRVPVLLKTGVNEFLFHLGRGKFKASLAEPPKPLCFNVADITLPDLIRDPRVMGGGPTFEELDANPWMETNEGMQLHGSITILNCTNKTIHKIAVAAGGANVPAPLTDLPSIAPLSIFKATFQFTVPPVDPNANEVKLAIRLIPTEADMSGEIDLHEVTLPFRRTTELHKRTFVSQQDFSAQYYAVQPPGPRAKGLSQPAASQPLSEKALVLSLHGAGVEALSQARSYASKDWAYIICPTNRRPYGFDWEDWGRADALEVLDHAQRHYKVDPRRVYLTGHSMGGHGTWQLAALYPDRFAAIGPSAGWESFWTYGAKPPPPPNTPLEKLFRRSVATSDTAALLGNLVGVPIYILHGDKDETVPVEQARTMRELLEKRGARVMYHEQPGAGHWWDDDEAREGVGCVDWPAMFEQFAQSQRPALPDVREIDFTTVNPLVSLGRDWAFIPQQVVVGLPSRAQLTLDPNARTIRGKTENVATLLLSVKHLPPDQPLILALDGATLDPIEWPASGRILATRNGGRWEAVGLGTEARLPGRFFGMKDSLAADMLIYGTKGSDAENAWMLAKARYDSETFWYRANSSLAVVPDWDVTNRGRPRKVVLYGNAKVNYVWGRFFGESAVNFQPGEATVGERKFTGEQHAGLFLRPGAQRPAVVGLAFTGLAGARATERLPLFVSGVGYPDCTIFGPDVLQKGLEAVALAGFYDAESKLDQAEWVEGGK